MVTGASRGIGRGVAIALADAGWRVFATGRTIAGAALPAQVARITCDHAEDAQSLRAFAEVAAAGGGLDVLVNAAWGGYERMVEEGRFSWLDPFWAQPIHRWTSMFDAGVRAAFVASQHAARLMLPSGRGLIIHLGFWAAQRHLGNAIYGAAKAATDKLAADMAHELRPHGIAVISLYPGLVRTESVLAAAAQGAFDLTNSESPEFIGRVIAALYADAGLMRRSGQVIVAAAAARELGVLDVDGKSPEPLSFDSLQGPSTSA